jgi:hypothetical protein
VATGPDQQAKLITGILPQLELFCQEFHKLDKYDGYHAI